MRERVLASDDGAWRSELGMPMDGGQGHDNKENKGQTTEGEHEDRRKKDNSARSVDDRGKQNREQRGHEEVQPDSVAREGRLDDSNDHVGPQADKRP